MLQTGSSIQAEVMMHSSYLRRFVRRSYFRDQNQQFVRFFLKTNFILIPKKLFFTEGVCAP